ncbi:MAG: hypothetical protein KKI02_11360 [Planctomycetes bacterium]|nr:hypothetical protein [Planctomycetota bacterium]
MLTRNPCLLSVWTLAAVTLLSAWTGSARAQDPNDPDLNEPPVILKDPQSQAVCEGWGAVFTVHAYGANLQYQWRKNQQELDGETDSTLVLSYVSTSDAGDYDVVVSNDAGWVESAIATLTVDIGPVITQGPQGQAVCQGVDVTLSVVATTYVGGLTYQWLKDDAPIDGATDDTLTLTSVTPADTADYSVEVSSPCGSVTSATALVAVDEGPVILEQPQNAAVCESAEHTLSVVIDDEGMTHVDTVGSTVSSGSGIRMRGNYYRVDTSTTLTRIEHYMEITTPGTLVFFAYEANGLSGPYSLIAQDTLADSGTGQRYYSSNPLSVSLEAGKYYLIGCAWPDLHTYYFDSSHRLGGTNPTAFGASVRGFAAGYVDPLPDPPPANYNDFAYMQRVTTSEVSLTYQWYRDDLELPGASGSEYTIAEMSADDVGDYHVVINSDCGSAASTSATITLDPGATIQADGGPFNVDACVGGQAEFWVTVEGAGWTYQWRKNAQDIEGATNDTYLISVVELSDAGVYDVVVGETCSVTSNPATLAVYSGGVTITEQPASIDACSGETVVFSVVATGATGYQWRKDDADIPDATEASYTIDPVGAEHTGDYSVVVSNPCDSVVSDYATLIVDQPFQFTTQPQDEDLCWAETCVLSVEVDQANVEYQWRKDGWDLPGATGDTFVIEAVEPNDAGTYDVVVSNACATLVSEPAEVGVFWTPVILDQTDEDQGLLVGQPLELRVVLDPADFSPATDWIGAASVEHYSGGKMRGNSYIVTDTVTLTKIEHYFNILAETPLVFFVYESEVSEQGPYSLVLEDTVQNPGTGARYYASNPANVRLEAGSYYIIGAAWSGELYYYRDQTVVLHPQQTTFGTTAHGFATYYTGYLPADPLPSQDLVWHQRLMTVSVDGFCQWRKNAAPIAGATADVYRVEAVSGADAGVYDAIIDNGCGTAVSDPVCVWVSSPGPSVRRLEPVAAVSPDPNSPTP